LLTINSSKKRFDLNIPGVSINTICVFCFKKIPLIEVRVVCDL